MKAFAKKAGPRIGRLSRSPQLRLLFLGALTALAIGGTGPGPSLLQRVASWPEARRGPVSAIDVSGHYGFVAIGEGGLLVLDLADPARPVRVGGYVPAGRTELVQVVGPRAYVGTLVHVGGGCEQEAWRSYLQVLDITDPVHPTLLGSYSTILQMHSLFVDGNLAYMGETGPELSAFRIVDVSNPARPVALRVERNGGASAIWASGERAYVCAWSTLRVLDVSHPSSPVVLTNMDLSMQALQGQTNRLYTVDSSRLAIYDLSSNVAPALLAKIQVPDSAVSLHVSGDRVYVACGPNGVVVIDVSNPGLPVRLGSCDTPGCATAVRTFGNHALVADSFGVQVIDLSDPVHPALLSGYDTGLTTRGVRVANGRAYVLSADIDRGFGTDARSRLEILDVNNPTQPVLLGAYQTSGFIRAWDISGEIAYLAFSSSTNGPAMEIVDVSYPPDPLCLSRTELTAGGDFSRLGLRRAGQYVYLANAGYGAQIFDVSAPAKPVRLNQAGTSVDAYAVQVAGDCAYLGSDWGIEVVDVSNPKAPVSAGSVAFQQPGNGGACLQVSEGYAYSGVGWNGFTITEVRSSKNPVLAGAYDTLGEVHDLCVADGRMFVAEGWQGLSVFDVSDPARPASIDRLATFGQAYGVQVSGNYAFVAEGGIGLSILSLAPGPITIVQDPVSLNAAVGETATLGVSAFGRGQLSYQWYAGASGDVSHPLAGATDPWFTTPKLTQTAAYWVRVSSSLGSADSRTAWVNPALPMSVDLVGMWPGHRRGPAVDLKVAGNLAYVAAGGLQIWDLSDEAAPRLVGSYDARGWTVTSLALAGNLALLSCNGQGLLVVDVSHAATPVLLGSFSTTNQSVGKAAVVGSIAYLAGSPLLILDISNPTQPRQLATAGASGNAVAVQGRYACLVGDQSMAMLDVNDPARPVVVADVHVFSGSANDVRLVGNYAYVAERLRWDGSTRYSGGLTVVDVSNPALPRRLSTYQVSTDSDAVAVDVIGTRALVADAGVQIVDVSAPAAPKRLGTLNTINTPLGLVASEQRAYLAATEGLELIDVTAPANPMLLRLIETGGSVQDVAVSGHYALVADDSAGLSILDVSDPRQPASLGAYRNNGYGRRVVVDGSVAYFLGDVLHLLDLSEPARPAYLGTSDVGSSANLVASGGYVYLGGPVLTAVDVRNPAEPKVLSVDPVEVIDSNMGMVLSPPHLFVAQGWEGMQTIDLSAPVEPKRLGAYYSEAPVSAVAVEGNVACVTVSSETPALDVVDIQDLSSPTRLASISLRAANNVARIGSYACVTGEGLEVFDLRDPQQPVHVGSHELGCATGRLAAAGDLVYAAAGEYGLAIYRLMPQLRLDRPVIDSSGMLLSWPGGAGTRLQRAMSLDAPVWQDVPYSEGASNLRLSLSNRSGFFRLVRP